MDEDNSTLLLVDATECSIMYNGRVGGGAFYDEDNAVKVIAMLLTDIEDKEHSFLIPVNTPLGHYILSGEFQRSIEKALSD